MWVLIMALAGWFGSRRSRFRSTMLGGIVGIEYLLGVLFALIALQAPLGIPVWLIGLAPTAILIPIVVVMRNKMSGSGETMEATPNECWKGAIFYYNQNDPVLCVERRDGLGYTFNFANPWSWVLLAGFAGVIASGGFVLG